MGQGLKRPHRLSCAALVAAVVLAHWWIPREIARLAPRLDADAGMPSRFEMVGLRELQATAPPQAGPNSPVAPPDAPATAQTPMLAVPMAEAASSPDSSADSSAESAAEPPTTQASAPEHDESAAAHASALAAAAAPSAASEPQSPPGAEPAAPARLSPPPQVAAQVAAQAASQATTDTQASAPPDAPAAPASTGGLTRPTTDASALPAGFTWPSATRIRYKLRGYYNGEVYGQARVDWAKQGPRYQINLDVGVNFAMLELFSRRMSSEGQITPKGLAPERYDEETKIALRNPVRSGVRFTDTDITLNNGRTVATWPGVQDTVSQFVQLTWLFANRPVPPKAGDTVELPLALPHNASLWVFDVQEPEWLETPFGPVQAWHLIPRRKESLGRSVLMAETWLAPAYRYLPVRIRITQGGAGGGEQATYLDLTITEPPQLAEGGVSPAAGAAPAKPPKP